ncbi:MAG: DNA-protecting protein DprA [Lachnospiraceae bacterium]|nr:DNA-protecting protein DprA [Lachnospiraceae bacterium]
MERRKYIKYSLIPGLGTVGRSKLMRLCGSIDACFEMSGDDILAADKAVSREHRIGEKRLRSFIDNRDSPILEHRTDELIAGCKEMGIYIITADDAEYPKRFSGLNDMPFVLYIRGRLDINNHSRSVGIVGARRCSHEGKFDAISCAGMETEKGNAIISGMAKGIDSYAHTAALKNNGYTIAVLGCGPDICYPIEHEDLYNEIIRKGCILSEYPPGTNPRKYMFPARNRLIAALSDKLYVIEAGRNSGTESTIRSCIKYGREYHRNAIF